MNTNLIAIGALSGIVHGFSRAAKKKLEAGDVEGAKHCLDTLMANFSDPLMAGAEYLKARKLKEDAIFDIECGERNYG